MTGKVSPSNIWPFALTRSVNTGFRIVVAPAFLVDHDKQALLHDAADGEPDEGAVYVREYRQPGSQQLWLLYRVVYLKASDVGLHGEYAMSGPRRTPLIEGVVCREQPSHLATKEFFADIHRACARAVRMFFEADVSSHPVSRSQEIVPPLSGLPMPIVELKPYLAEGSIPTALDGRRPPGAPGHPSTSWPRFDLFATFGRVRRTAPDRSGAGTPVGHHGRRAAKTDRPHHGSETGRPGKPRRSFGRRLAGAAAVIVLAMLVGFAIRKFK